MNALLRNKRHYLILAAANTGKTYWMIHFWTLESSHAIFLKETFYKISICMDLYAIASLNN